MTSTHQLAGYLLEEVVAHLLAASGYRLLAHDDDEAFVKKGNGLRVRGRGAEHQADALGDLSFTIPFSLPVRLFVEAKNTTAKVGLDVVRNAHGIVSDVNEYVRSTTDSITKPEHLRRVQYRYSIFATGGFTADAQSFAFAHQISLIDLSGPSWQMIGDTLRQAAAELTLVSGQAAAGPARWALRRALSRMSEGAILHGSDADELTGWATRVVGNLFESDEDQELLLGFVDAPFVLALRSTTPGALRRHMSGQLKPLRVHIGYDRRGREKGEWRIQDAQEPGAFDLTFALPGVLEAVLLESEAGYGQAASAAKKTLMQAITVYLDGRPVRLVYERSPRTTDHIPETASDSSPLRESRRPLEDEPSSPVRDLRMLERGSLPAKRRLWTVDAVGELFHRLPRSRYVQVKLIEYAVRNDGWISRDEIYTVAEFDETRRLNGLARPTNRITTQLIDEGLLPADADFPFTAEYEHNKLVGYRVPEEIGRILRRKLKRRPPGR